MGDGLVLEIKPSQRLNLLKQLNLAKGRSSLFAEKSFPKCSSKVTIRVTLRSRGTRSPKSECSRIRVSGSSLKLQREILKDFLPKAKRNL